VEHLHHKWCVHSILPVAPRVKQPIHVNTQNINYTTENKKLLCCPDRNINTKHVHTHTVQWAVELDRFQLAAGGGERSGPNMSLWLLFSFMLGSAWRVGGNIVSCERVRNCSHVTGLCVSQQCQLRIGRCVKPCALNSLPCYWISCRFYIEREDKKFKNVLAEKFFSLKSSSLLNHELFFKYFNIFLFNRFGLSTSVFTETSDFISQLTLFKSDFFFNLENKVKLFHFFLIFPFQNLLGLSGGGTRLLVRILWISFTL